MSIENLMSKLDSDLAAVLGEMEEDNGPPAAASYAASASAPQRAVSVNRHGSISIGANAGGPRFAAAAAEVASAAPPAARRPTGGISSMEQSVWAQLAVAQSEIRVLKAQVGREHADDVSMESIKAAEAYSRKAVHDTEVMLSAAQAERSTLDQQLRAQRKFTSALEDRVARATAEQRQTAAELSALRARSKLTSAEGADALAKEVATREELQTELERVCDELAQALTMRVEAETLAKLLPSAQSNEAQLRREVAATAVQLRNLSTALQQKAREADASAAQSQGLEAELEQAKHTIAETRDALNHSTAEARDAMEAAEIFETRMTEIDARASALQRKLDHSGADAKRAYEGQIEELTERARAATARAVAGEAAAESTAARVAVLTDDLRRVTSERDDCNRLTASLRSELDKRVAEMGALEARRAEDVAHGANAMDMAHAAQAAFERAVAEEQKGADALAVAQQRQAEIERRCDDTMAQNDEQRELLSQMVEKLQQKDSESKSLSRALAKKTSEAASLASALTQLDKLSAVKLKAGKAGLSSAEAEMEELKQRVIMAERRADEVRAALDASEDARRELDHQLQLKQMNALTQARSAAAPAVSVKRHGSVTIGAASPAAAATRRGVGSAATAAAMRTPARAHLFASSPFASPSTELLKAQQALRQVTEQLNAASGDGK